MELTNEFTVPVPVDRAWEVLTDVELIAPCLPGAQLQEIEGDEYRGVVKVKVGPITAQYKGAATFQEQDEAGRRLVLKAEGRDTRGQGSASALITVTMHEHTGSTHVSVHTDLTIKGKVAQFGRGMIADVSAKLLTQFVECLEGKLEAPAGAAAVVEEAPAPVPAPTDVPTGPTAEEHAAAEALAGAQAAPAAPAPAAEAAPAAEPAPAAEAPTVRRISAPEPEAVDLVEAAGASMAKRIVPVVVVLLVLWLLGRRRAHTSG